MADARIAVDEPAVADLYLDTETVTTGVGEVHRERVQIAGTGATQIAPVSATDGLLVNLGANNDVTVASLPLPTGAATAAKQPALGTAGTPSADVISIQGVASGTVVPVSDGGGSLTVDGTVGVSGSVAVTGTFWQATQPVSGPLTDTQLRATAVPVSLASVPSHAVTNAGTFAVQAATAGDVAHDGADSGNPVKVGGKAATALPTAVAASDRTNLLTDVYGRAFVRTGAEGPAGSSWAQAHEPAANTQATTSKAAGGAGVRHVCTGFSATFAAGATAPTAINVSVRLRDGATGAGTVLWAATLSLPATAGASVGVARQGLWIVGSQNTAMTLEFSAAGGANTYEVVSLEGVTVAE